MPSFDRLQLPSFVAESTLGKLAKWLCLAGFDTHYDSNVPDFHHLNRIALTQNRTVLTRTQTIIKKLAPPRGLFIRFDAPLDQVRQVLRHFNVRRSDLRPLSRCSRCNRALRQVDKASIQGAVPDFIWQRHVRFQICIQCRRIHWPGTHYARTLALIDRWFESYPCLDVGA